LDEEPALVEVHLYRVRLIHDRLNGCCTHYEQSGLIFLLCLCGVHFLVLLLLPAFTSPMFVLSIVAALIAYDVAASCATT
jgi:hypothetical protein